MADKAEAVRLLLAEDGGMTNEALAEALKARFGLDVKPGIVAVIRASFKWREVVAVKMEESAALAASLPPPKPKGRKKAGPGERGLRGTGLIDPAWRAFSDFARHPVSGQAGVAA
jgi:hypothetical protein